MIKKKYLFSLFAIGIGLSLTSCHKDNDDDDIDQEWKALNETRFTEVANSGLYNQLKSQTDNGFVYWISSQVITDSDTSLRITPSGNPEFTDTVVVRYEGWYIDTNGKKVIFDSTENTSVRSNLVYSLGESNSPYPNKQPATLAVNPNTQSSASNGYIGGVIQGWSTILQDMKVGEEREVCIPQQLAYGSSPALYTSPNTTVSYIIVPAYTTLWFDIKLLRIIPMNGIS